MTYSTHPFRPIVGNAAFCADCPAGSSFGPTHPWHVGHAPVSLEQAKLALTRTPAEALYAELASRQCLPFRVNGGAPTCTTHRLPTDDSGLCDVGRPQALVARNTAWLTWDDRGVPATRAAVDASDLGLATGEWPDTLLVPGPTGALVAMRVTQRDLRNGDLVSVTYRALLGGLSLIVAND